MKSTIVAVIVVSFVSLVAACGLPGGRVDDSPFISEIGFNNPLTLTVQLDEAYRTDPNFLDGDNMAAIALLWKQGAIVVTPNPDASPWWRFDVHSGNLENEHLTIPIAHREITDRTEVRQWTQQSIPFFAETVQYRVQVDAPFQVAGLGRFEHYSFRLVLNNDPAVGHWTRQEPNGSGAFDDTTQLQQAISQAGSGVIGELSHAIGNAKVQAYAQIEQRLSSSGTLSRSPKNHDVLVSTSLGRAYYIHPNEQSGMTVGGFVHYCRSVRAKGFGPWRLPNDQELAATTQPGVQGLHELIDTPDRRFWGTIGTPPASGEIPFPTATITDNSGNRYDLSNPPAEAYGTSIHIFNLTYQGLFQQNSYSLNINTATGDQLLQRRYDNPMRIICVTDLSNKTQ